MLPPRFSSASSSGPGTLWGQVSHFLRLEHIKMWLKSTARAAVIISNHTTTLWPSRSASVMTSWRQVIPTRDRVSLVAWQTKHMHTNTNDGNTNTTSSWPDMKAPPPWRPASGRMPGWIPWSPWLKWTGRRMWWCLYRGGGPKWKTSSKLKFFHFWDKLISNCIWSLCL